MKSLIEERQGYIMVSGLRAPNDQMLAMGYFQIVALVLYYELVLSNILNN